MFDSKRLCFDGQRFSKVDGPERRRKFVISLSVST